MSAETLYAPSRFADGAAPSALTKAALQEILQRKNIPFSSRMTKDQLWALTKQAEPQAVVGKSSAGEY